jgi:hypothetical protein
MGLCVRPILSGIFGIALVGIRLRAWRKNKLSKVLSSLLDEGEWS